MFKKIKKFFDNVNSIPTLAENMETTSQLIAATQRDVQAIAASQTSQNSRYTYPAIRITNNELTTTRKAYEDILYKKAYASMRKLRGKMQESVVMYDKLLYQSSERIATGSYLTLLDITFKLDILRSFILECLFGKTEVFSFYLYLVNTEQLNRSLETLPAIDINKVFMIDDIPDRLIEEDTYAELCMTRNRLVITSPIAVYEFGSMFRKTVLRVMYSVYTKQYILYHLINDETNDDDINEEENEYVFSSNHYSDKAGDS